jgi:hypothetical protein
VEQNKKVINEADGKIIAEKERPQRNGWFDEECQIRVILEHKKEVINRTTREHEDGYKDKK